MSLTSDEFEIDGYKLDPVVTERITDARLIGRDTGAMSIEITVWDGDWRLRREGKLTRSSVPKKGPFKQASWARLGEARLIFDGILFRLAAVDAAIGSPLVRMTWDDEAAALMRRHTREIAVSRGVKTRAQVIGLGVAAVHEIAIPFRCPEEKISQDIEAPADDDAEDKGLSGSITVNGAKASREQRKNLETALATADRLKAGERATLALIVAGITESNWVNVTGGDRDSQGVLQVRLSTAITIKPRSIIPVLGDAHASPAGAVPGVGDITSDVTGRIAPGTLDPRDVKEVCRVFLLRGFRGRGGAIELAAKNPDMTIQMIAQNVQGSKYEDGSNYAPFVNEAKAILDAWGGVGQVSVLRESFDFRLGGKEDPDDDTEKPENYWAGVNRLGSEKDGWGLWAWRNQVNFASDEWLFKRKPVFTIGPESVIPEIRPAGSLAPIVKIGHRADAGSTVAEVTVETVSRRWDGAPGSTVLIDDLGEISGKWLISENDFDLQRDIATLRLRRPVAKAPEPAPDTTTRVLTESRRQESGSPRARILTAARRALRLTKNFYYFTGSASRPMPGSLFQNVDAATGAGPIQPLGVDCSAFVTLVYKAAGAPDPNGLNYNGGGNTSTLRANGRKTNDPQPGDLAHYGTGAPGGASHVGIYIGNGKIIQIGGAAGVSELDVHYRNDFAGYWTYPLEA